MPKCDLCNKEIIWNGNNWEHNEGDTPRHRASLALAKDPEILKPNAVKEPGIPQDVFNLFNKMIKEKWLKGKAVLLQPEVAERVSKLMGMDTQAIFDNHWLDVEEFYKQAGWNVVYDKPAYNETFKASWTFTKPPNE